MNTDKKPFLDTQRIENASLKLRACNHRFRLAILNILNNEGPVDLPHLVKSLGLRTEYVAGHLEFLLKTGLVFRLPNGSFDLNVENLAAINASLKGFSRK